MEQYYKILGLPSDADFAQVKKAYKVLVKVWHPDRYQDDPVVQAEANKKLKDINEAYEKISAYHFTRESSQPQTQTENQTRQTASTTKTEQQNRRHYESAEPLREEGSNKSSSLLFISLTSAAALLLGLFWVANNGRLDMKMPSPNTLWTSIHVALSSAEGLNTTGKEKLKNEDIEGALEDFNKAIEKDPKYAEAYLNRGFVYGNTGELKKALADFDKAIALDSGYVEAYYNRGFIYGYFEEYEKSMADYSRVIELNPKDAEAYINRALIRSRLGDREGELADLKEAARLGDPTARSWLQDNNIDWEEKPVNSGPNESAIEENNTELSFEPKGQMQEEKSFGDYVVRTYRNDEGISGGSLEILRKGVRVHAAHGHRFQIGSIYEEDKPYSLINIGTDITGDGRPNLVVSEWTGGAHCCFLFHLFEIGSRFRHIQTINTEHSGSADFENLDNDPALEFRTNDWTFAYWRTGFASSPAPKVILKYKGEKYGMAYDLMQKPSLSYDELVQQVKDIGASEEWEKKQPPVMLWSKMLDLIYAGNMFQAWVLFEVSWPDRIDGKEDFLKDFKSRLASSPYWKDVQKLNDKET